MSKQDTPPDLPKVQVELNTPHSRHTQTLDIQSNRTSPVDKFIWHWLSYLYPPANPIDFALDVAAFVLAGGLLCSLTLRFSSLLNQAIALVMLWIILCALLTVGYFICVGIKRGWILLLYRLILLITGAYLGVMGHG